MMPFSSYATRVMICPAIGVLWRSQPAFAQWTWTRRTLLRIVVRQLFEAFGIHSSESEFSLYATPTI